MSSKELNDAAISYRPEGFPETPYLRAKQEWDDRLGAARVQAGNWRIMALTVSGLAMILGAGLVYQTSRSSVVPYVVQVNADGLVQAVGPAARTNYVPNKAVLQYFLGQFVTRVRSIPLDPVVAKQDWLAAYAYLRQSAANSLSEIARREQPMGRVGREMVSVQIKSVVPQSQETFQVRWEETTYSKEGIPTGSKNMTGLFTVEVVPPTDEKALAANPLGLYIKQFAWSQDF